MIKLSDTGVWLLNGTSVIADDADAGAKLQSALGHVPSREEAQKGTIAY